MLFHRFLLTILQLFAMLAVVILPILIPLNVVHGKNITGEIESLDRLSWANVGANHPDYYWAHLVLLLYTVALTCAVIYRETTFFVKIRQRCLWSQSQTSKLGMRTILITGIPEHLRDPEKLRTLYDSAFGDVQTVWINRDCRKLTKALRHREKLRILLEVAESKLIRRSLSMRTTEATEDRWTKTDKSLCSQHIRQDERQGIRLALLPWLPVLPMIGKKVDLIEHYRKEMIRYNDDVSKIQADVTRYSAVSSAFIMFKNAKSANIASQSLIDPRPATMTVQCIGVEPQDILWKNIGFGWWERTLRTLCARLCVLFLIGAWALPIAFTGFLSQVSYVMDFSPRLKFLTELSKPALSLVQGFFPQALLMLFTILLPQFIRIITEQQGLLTTSAVELSVQTYYFGFLFIQIFLTVSLSASFTTIANQIYHGFDSVPKTLAQNLPKTSNYFFSYILLQALSISAGQLIQIMTLIRWYILAPLFDITPRAKVHRKRFLHTQMQWGTIFPVFTNLACIGKYHHSI